MDALVIADSGADTFSGTNPLKLTIDGRIADIQTVKNIVANNGRLRPPIKGASRMNWAAAPKLNGIYLKNFLSRCGFEVALINSFYEQRNTFITLLKQSPIAILVSTTFITNKSSLSQLVADIRSLAPNIPIIAGGPFIYLSYGILQRAHQKEYISEEIKKEYLFLEVDREPSIDLYIASSRGESMAQEALQRLITGAELAELPNSVIFENDRYIFSQRVDDLAAPMPPIDWQRLEPQIFASGVVPLQASSGCPYHCAFCNFVKDPKSARIKPIDELIEEMRCISRRGGRYIWFVDDNFRLGQDDLEAVCRKIIAADLDVSWMTFIRASTLDHIDPGLLRRAGCIEVQLGLESADTQVLQNMNKKASPELYEKVLFKLLEAGINCACYLIFGFPGESEASVQRTIAFMKKFDDLQDGGTLSWSMFPFIVAPLSPIHELDMREKYRLEGYLQHWRHATMDARKAAGHVRRAFLSVASSGAIYRSDNLESLARLTSAQRHDFHRIRQQLAQKAIGNELPREEILDAFKPVFCGLTGHGRLDRDKKPIFGYEQQLQGGHS